MTTTLKKYRIYCTTEGQYRYIWDTAVPTTCPFDGAHTVVAGSANALNTVYDFKVYNTTSPSPELRGYNVIRLDAAGGAIDLQMPPVSLNNERIVVIQRLASNANVVRLLPDGTDKINNVAAPYILTGDKSITATTNAFVKLRGKLSTSDWEVLGIETTNGELDGELEAQLYKDSFDIPATDTEIVIYDQTKNDFSNYKLYTATTTDPTTGDDSADGYRVGSRWVNITTDVEFICLDNTATSAVWAKTTLVSTNVGTGQGIYKDTTNGTENFKSLTATSTRIGLTGNTNDIGIDVVEANVNINNLNGTLTVANGGTGATAFTAGSVIFSNGTTLTLDNANLFWDDTNDRLGIGNNAPAVPLHVTGAAKITGELDMTSQKITNLALPTTGTDAANKTYVDSVVSGLDVKESVKLASTQNLLAEASVSTAVYNNTGGASGRGQITGTLAVSDTLTIDGVTLSAAQDGTRILLKNQIDPAENGIWVTTISGTSYTLDRATDFDQDVEVTASAFTFVEEGTTNGDNGFVVVSNDPLTIGGAGGSNIVWAQFSGAGQITAGNGLSKTGNQLDVNVDTTSIEISADTLQLVSAPTAKGDLLTHTGVVQNSLSVGTNRQILVADSTAPNGIKWSNVPFRYWVIIDSKATATNGGTATAAAWTKRTLNTVDINGGTDVTLATDQITIQAGDYILRARSPFFKVTGARIRLRNTTDVSTDAESQNIWATSHANAELSARLTLASAKVYEIQYYVLITQDTNDLGNALGVTGENEIYTIVEIQQL